MATSIARLAVILSTDTRQLSAGLKAAANDIRRFSANTTTANAATNALSAGMLRVGAAGLAFLTVQKLAKFLKAAAEASGDLRERLDAVNGTKSPNTLREQYERLWDTIAFAGLPVVDKLGAALDNVLTSLDEGLKRDGFKGFKDSLEQLKKDEAALKSRKEAAEAAAKAEKEAAEERARALDRLRDRAKDLETSLRTPLEIMREEQAELQQLFRQGFLSSVTYNRGIARIADEFREATKAATEFKNKARTIPAGIAAAEMGTQAALSAAREAHLSALQLAEMRKQTAAQNGIIRAIEEKKTVKFAVGKLG